MATSSAQSQSDSFGIVFRPLNRNRINKLKTTATSSLKHLKNRIVTNQVSKLALFTMQTKWKKCRHFPTSTRPGDFFCCGFKLTSVRNLFHYFYSIEFFTHCVAAWRENFPNPPWTNKAVKKSLILKKSALFHTSFEKLRDRVTRNWEWPPAMRTIQENSKGFKAINLYKLTLKGVECSRVSSGHFFCY